MTTPIGTAEVAAEGEEVAAEEAAEAADQPIGAGGTTKKIKIRHAGRNGKMATLDRQRPVLRRSWRPTQVETLFRN